MYWHVGKTTRIIGHLQTEI